MDDKAWPSLNEAVNDELKPDSVINNVKGSIATHDGMKVTENSEVVCYTFFCSFFWMKHNVSIELFPFDDFHYEILIVEI